MPIFGSTESDSLVIGFATLTIWFLFDMLGNWVSDDIDNATKNSKSIVLKNLKYVVSSCVLAALLIFKYRYEQRSQNQPQARATPAGQDQSPSVQHQASPNPSRSFERSSSSQWRLNTMELLKRIPNNMGEGMKQLNNSVWELYSADSDGPFCQVIFFHGLQVSGYRDAFWKTWLSRDGTTIWPKRWLAADVWHARILSISYESSARVTNGSDVSDMDQIIENLMQDIVLSPSFNIDQDSPVILVGHSMGGLIIRQLLLKCNEVERLLDPHNPTQENQKHKIRMFLENCDGIFYYSTPNLGSALDGYAALADHAPGAEEDMPTINLWRTLSKEIPRINNEFREFRLTHMQNVTTYAIGESEDTTFMGVNIRVVPEASAQFEVDKFSLVAANHFEVCRIEGYSSIIYNLLHELCELWIGRR